MKHLVIQTDPEMPAARLPVCTKCNAFMQSPSPECPETHGTANPREVMRQLCNVVGHALFAGGRPRPRCLRCGRPRAEVEV